MAELFWLPDLQGWDLGMEKQQNQMSSSFQQAFGLPASVESALGTGGKPEQDG